MNKLLLALIMLVTLNVNAQKDHDKVEKVIEAKKIGYLTEKLDLSPKEAEVFWPIYNSYSDKMKSYKQEKFRRNEKEDANVNAEQALKDLINNEKNVVTLKEEYVDKFKQAIGADKTLKLFSAEGEFKREILKGMKKRRERGKKEEMKSKSKDK